MEDTDWVIKGPKGEVQEIKDVLLCFLARDKGPHVLHSVKCKFGSKNLSITPDNPEVTEYCKGQKWYLGTFKSCKGYFHHMMFCVCNHVHIKRSIALHYILYSHTHRSLHHMWS